MRDGRFSTQSTGRDEALSGELREGLSFDRIDDGLTESERAELASVREEEARDAQAERWARKYAMKFEDALAYVKSGLPESAIPDFPAARKAMGKYLRTQQVAPPKWLLITKLWPESEAAMPHKQRRAAVRKLYRILMVLIRDILKDSEQDPNKAERTIYWDPVVEICREMEIGQSKLSSFCREFSGLSLKEVIDAVRAEGLRERLKRGLGVRGEGSGGRNDAGLGGQEGRGPRSRARCAVFAAYQEIRAARKEDLGWSLDGWARSLGFASYRRMYKACVVVYGKAPRELELEIIGECLSEDGSHEETKAPRQAEKDIEGHCIKTMGGGVENGDGKLQI